jgi:hypothetical protein
MMSRPARHRRAGFRERAERRMTSERQFNTVFLVLFLFRGNRTTDQHLIICNRRRRLPDVGDSAIIELGSASSTGSLTATEWRAKPARFSEFQ